MSVALAIAVCIAAVATFVTGLWSCVEYGNPLVLPLSHMRSRNRVVQIACNLLRDGRDWEVDRWSDRLTHPCGLTVRTKYAHSAELLLDGQAVTLTGPDIRRLRLAQKSTHGLTEQQALLLASRIIERYDDSKVVPLRRRS